MPIVAGILIALGVGLLARATGMDRDRAFYPTALIVIAAYYVLFAVMGSSTHALVHECLAASLFLTAAIVGFRSSLWVVAIATAAHGVFDFGHAWIITNPGMPGWWPQFCGAADVGIAAWLAWLLKRGSIPARPGNAGGAPGVTATC